MDDGSDRVITRIPKKETRSSASLWFAAGICLMVLLGAGCVKPQPPQSPAAVQQPQPQVQSPAPQVQALNPTSRTEAKDGGWPVWCYAQTMTYEVMRATLADALKDHNSNGAIFDQLQFTEAAGDLIQGFCVVPITDTSGASPVGVLLAKGESLQFLWAGSMPTEEDPFNEGTVLSPEFKLKSAQPLVWGFNGRIFTGKTDKDTVIFDVDKNILTVNGIAIK